MLGHQLRVLIMLGGGRHGEPIARGHPGVDALLIDGRAQSACQDENEKRKYRRAEDALNLRYDTNV